jgi:cytochrome P450 family 6
MTYIEQIIEETIRINPPFANFHRVVTKDYKLPNGSTILRGTKVIVPVLAIQRDPDIFQDPMKFDPERFTPEAEQSRHLFSTIPFGRGF